MVMPLWAMVIGTHVWFVGSLLARARADNLRREAGKDWVVRSAGGTHMSYREYVIAAYVVFALMLAWDWLAPKLAIARARRAALQLAKRRAARDGQSETTR